MHHHRQATPAGRVHHPNGMEAEFSQQHIRLMDPGQPPGHQGWKHGRQPLPAQAGADLAEQHRTAIGPLARSALQRQV